MNEPEQDRIESVPVPEAEVTEDRQGKEDAAQPEGVEASTIEGPALQGERADVDAPAKARSEGIEEADAQAQDADEALPHAEAEDKPQAVAEDEPEADEVTAEAEAEAELADEAEKTADEQAAQAEEEPAREDAEQDEDLPEGEEPVEEAEPASAAESAAEEPVAEAEEEPAREDAEQDEDLPEGEEPDDGRRWYVVHCYSGYENKVRHNLEQRIESMGMKDKIFDVVVPTEEEIEVKDGKRRTVERRVFPGYILVQMIMDEDSWYVVRNTPGVTGFVGMGNEPTALRPEEVAQIIKRMEAEAPRIKVTYKIGQKVRIIDGPFNDFIGTVDDIDMERAKVRVMVSFFGRETPVELDFLQVEKA